MREAACKRVGAEQSDLGPGAGLHDMAPAQVVGLGLGPGEVEIAVLVEGDAEPANRLEPEGRDPTLSALENCCRMPLAESAVAARA